MPNNSDPTWSRQKHLEEREITKQQNKSPSSYLVESVWKKIDLVFHSALFAYFIEIDFRMNYFYLAFEKKSKFDFGIIDLVENTSLFFLTRLYTNYYPPLFLSFYNLDDTQLLCIYTCRESLFLICFYCWGLHTKYGRR